MTETSKGGCVVSTHEFVMGYTPLQRTRKGNKIGSSRGTALHSAGPLGKGQMRHGVVTTTPRTRRGAGKRILLGRGQFLRIIFSKFALNSNDTAVYRNTSVDNADAHAGAGVERWPTGMGVVMAQAAGTQREEAGERRLRALQADGR